MVINVEFDILSRHIGKNFNLEKGNYNAEKLNSMAYLIIMKD